MRLRLLLLLLAIAVPGTSVAQVTIEVEASKKTEKTSEDNYSYFVRTHYVDRVNLNITVTGKDSAEIVSYFIARDVKTQLLKYHGVDRREVILAGKTLVKTQSDPAASSQKKESSKTADKKLGDLPFGWVVKVSQNGKDVFKSSSPEALKWVQANPPKKTPQYSR